jgi:hypothetical protein
VTQAVAELSTQTQGQGRPPHRRVVHWRYGMGFVVLLASISSLVLVGQIAGWIQNPHESAQAEASADYRASLLQLALRTLPDPEGAMVPEASYAEAVRAVGGVLLDVDYPVAPGSLPTGFTVRLTGSATSGVLSGHHTTMVTRCFHYGWQSVTATAVHQLIACPGAGADGARPAARTGTGAGGSDPTGSGAALLGLSVRLAGLAPAEKEVSADDTGTRQLLDAAGLVPGVPWTVLYPERAGGTPTSDGARDTVLAIGAGGPAGCLFVDVHAGVLTAWTAPQSVPCTAERASRAVLVRDA